MSTSSVPPSADEPDLDARERLPPRETLEHLRRLDPALDDACVGKLGRFLDLLRSGNQQMNLTAVREHEMWQRHILDSLSLLPWFPEAGRSADLGSGGGLPALPLAIVRPRMQMMLVESVGKKAAFLEQAARDLQLDQIRVCNERIEDVGRSDARASMDVVTARALARLPVLLELAIPLLRVGGRLLAIKGEQAEREIEEARVALVELRAEVEHVHRTDTGTVVVIHKRDKTPKRYPRRPGEPKRKPLA